MFKRLTGFFFGYLAGLLSSWYLVRRIRERLARYRPPAVANRVTRGVTTAGQTVRAAVADGRVAMRDREAELRAELATNGDGYRAP
ncbi:MAG: hypothetical protein U0V73_08560 [Acidimicrobiia bacterium]